MEICNRLMDCISNLVLFFFRFIFFNLAERDKNQAAFPPPFSFPHCFLNINPNRHTHKKKRKFGVFVTTQSSSRRFFACSTLVKYKEMVPDKRRCRRLNICFWVAKLFLFFFFSFVFLEQSVAISHRSKGQLVFFAAAAPQKEKKKNGQKPMTHISVFRRRNDITSLNSSSFNRCPHLFECRMMGTKINQPSRRHLGKLDK